METNLTSLTLKYDFSNLNVIHLFASNYDVAVKFWRILCGITSQGCNVLKNTHLL